MISRQQKFLNSWHSSQDYKPLMSPKLLTAKEIRQHNSCSDKPTIAVLLCGSRDFDDEDRLQAVFVALFNVFNTKLLISGGARGADSYAPQLASQWGVDLIEVYPDWGMHGKGAGPKRNQQMLDVLLNQSVVNRLIVSFWNGSSRGTYDMMVRGLQASVPVLCCFQDQAILLNPLKNDVADLRNALNLYSRQAIQL